MVKKIHSLGREKLPLLGMRHLQMVVAIAASGNLTRAAGDLGVTPSALSHRLGEAERRIGKMLFEREGRRATLTPAGQTILRAAERALGTMAEAEADVSRLHGGSFDRAIRLGVGHYPAYQWFPAFYDQWHAQFRDLHVFVRADLQRDPLKELREGAVDLLVLPYRPEEASFDSVDLFEDQLVFICALSDPLAKADALSSEDLGGRTFFTYTRQVVPDQEYQRFIRPERARTDKWLDMEDPKLIAELVARGLGVSILSRWALREFAMSQHVAQLRVGAKGLPITWCVASLRAKRADTEMMAVRDAVLAYFNASSDGV